MFGKRKSPPPPKKPEVPMGIGTFATVIVPRAAATQAGDPKTADRLVQALVDFVNGMMREGLYTRFEMLPKAVQAYHADFYLAQVNNGGHAQFIHNSFGNLDIAVADMRAALAEMNAEDHRAVADRFADWLGRNRERIADGTAFLGEEGALLGSLDKAFYAANETVPLGPLLGRWIAGWPELRVVDDADYQEAVRLSAAMNPLRELRLLADSVARLTRQMTDRLQVGIGLACCNTPTTEMKLELGIGTAMEIEGVRQKVFYVRTNLGTRLCVVADSHAAAYELVQPANPPMPKMSEAEGVLAALNDGRVLQFKGPSAGQKLSHVQPETIAEVIALANRFRAPVALDLVLRRAGIARKGAKVAPMAIKSEADQPVVFWLVAAGDQPLFAISAAESMMLFRLGAERPIAVVRRAEIEEHAGLAAAALDSLGAELVATLDRG